MEQLLISTGLACLSWAAAFFAVYAIRRARREAAAHPPKVDVVFAVWGDGGPGEATCWVYADHAAGERKAHQVAALIGEHVDGPSVYGYVTCPVYDSWEAGEAAQKAGRNAARAALEERRRG